MTRDRLRKLVPVLLIILTLAGFALHQAGILQPFEGLLLRVTSPLQEGVTAIAAGIGELAQTARDLRDLRQRNEELEAQNASLLLENVRLREIEVEAALLRDLLDFVQPNPSFDVQGAHVIGREIARDPSNLQRTILLDVGREAGVALTCP
jgi:rod shape-determining protein MreC